MLGEQGVTCETLCGCLWVISDTFVLGVNIVQSMLYVL